MPPVAKREFAALDGLRAWAVIMVWNVHFFDAWWRSDYGLSPSSPLRPLLATVHSGHVGVDLFFVLSGFIIFHTLHKRATGFVPFMRRRYARLLPAHLFIVAPGLIAYLAAPGSRLGDALWNVILVEELVAGCKVINFVTWSLSYELVWYALAAGWFTPALRRVRGWPLFFGLFAVLATAHFMGCSQTAHAGIKVPDLSRFLGFLMGFGVARLYFESPSLLHRAAALLRGAAPLSLAAVFAVRWYWTRTGAAERAAPLWQLGFYLAVDLAFSVLLAATLVGPSPLRRLFSHPALQWLGRVSYSFYLVHALYGLPLGAAIAGRLPLTGVPAMAASWLVGVTATCLLAAASFRFLERPYFQSAP